MDNGYIKLHRSIYDHWIWKDPVKFQWWVDILMVVNHTGSKVNLGMQLIECKRGQSVMSLNTWAMRWRVSKDKVRNFFVLLEKDGMILHDNVGKSTRITVCNYDTYQCVLHANQTQTKRKPNATPTQTINEELMNNKLLSNDNNYTPEKNENFIKFQIWIDNNAPRVNKMKEPFTESQFEALKNDFTTKDIEDLLIDMHNYEPLLTKSRNANLTFRNWIKRRTANNSNYGKTNNSRASKEILGDPAKRTTTIPRPARNE